MNELAGRQRGACWALLSALGIAVGATIRLSMHYFAATLVDSRTQRARWAWPIDTSDGTACSQTGCTCLHRGAKAQPGGRFIRSGGVLGIAAKRPPLTCVLPARDANRPPV
jgi:hypothetical protein